MPTQLTTHFSLEELVSSQQRHLDNTPTPEIIEKLKDLAKFLERARYIIGAIHINSGYRSPEVNEAVGGKPTSQHLKGEAADCVPLFVSLKEATRLLVDSDLAYDQLIYEFGSWVHLSYAPKGRKPRRQALMVGKWTGGDYKVLDLNVCP